MSVSSWSEQKTARALEIWRDYAQTNDLSGVMGQTAGIDPVSGRIWLGDSASDIWAQMESEGIDTPLYYVRVGLDYYVRKGGHR